MQHYILNRMIAAMQLNSRWFLQTKSLKTLTQRKVFRISKFQLFFFLHFRDNQWPGGTLAEPLPPRDQGTRMRNRVVTKTKMLGTIDDELKSFLGKSSAHIQPFSQAPLTLSLSYSLPPPPLILSWLPLAHSFSPLLFPSFNPLLILPLSRLVTRVLERETQSLLKSKCYCL